MRTKSKKIRTVENLAGNPDTPELRKQLHNLFVASGKLEPHFFKTLANNFKDEKMVEIIFSWARLYISNQITVAEIKAKMKALKKSEIKFTSDLRARKGRGTAVSVNIRD